MKHSKKNNTLYLLKKNIFVVYDIINGVHCSKLSTTVEKAENLFNLFNKNKLEILDIMSEENKKKFKFHYSQPRYQDKRLVERVIKEYFSIENKEPPKTKIKKEPTVPVRISKNTVLFLTKKDIEKNPLKYFCTLEAAQKRLEVFKNIN